jgi:hypothetical protein
MRRTTTILAVSALALALTAPARAAETFTDARGDNGEAHDITTVGVSNDAMQVVVSFPVPSPLPNLMQPDDQKWLLLIDTDRSASTGDDGAELRVIRDSSAFVELWNGSVWIDAPPAGISVRFELSSASTSWRVQLPRALFGNTAGFDFRLTFAKVVGDEIVAADRAPDAGWWRYALQEPVRVKLQLQPAVVTPARARVGSSVFVRARLSEVGTGKAAPGQVLCKIRTGGSVVRISGRISTGVASCRPRVPRARSGTVVRGTMTVVGAMHPVSFTFRVA